MSQTPPVPPEAIDLSHHLSDLSRARNPSPLKSLFKYWGKPGVVSLAGGLPSESYFPFASISANTLISSSFPTTPTQAPSSSFSWLWNFFGSGNKERTDIITIPKFPTPGNPTDVTLGQALQYGTATGIPALGTFLTEYTRKIYRPAYADYTTLVQVGNTDGWAKVVMTLCNPGEALIVEHWTYPSAIAESSPMAIKPFGVPMDSQGMLPGKLEEMLANWDEASTGYKRPHVMYTVPVGQNPSGLTAGPERKRAIYEVCVKYDIIIVEDDPYFILQEGDYVPKSRRDALSSSHAKTGSDEEQEFIDSLVPSYLRFDYQGRVIRLDTFSKTIAPGTRLGWFTCNPMFAERLLRQGETSTQAPCGFGQALITQLITNHWGMSGYIRWLRGLRAQYTSRRDFMVDCFMEEFDITESTGEGIWGGSRVFEARKKIPLARGEKHVMPEKGQNKVLFSFVPPTSGMFLWIKMHFENLPSHKLTQYQSEIAAAPGLPTEENSIELKLWVNLAEGGLLLAPGWIFAPDWKDKKLLTNGHYRMSFSNAEFDVIKKAIGLFKDIVEDFFE